MNNIIISVWFLLLHSWKVLSLDLLLERSFTFQPKSSFQQLFAERNVLVFLHPGVIFSVTNTQKIKSFF